MTVIVIHGPMASGKTRNAERFRSHYGRTRIVDGWVADDERELRPGDLVLTYEHPDEIRRSIRNARLISIEEASQAIGAPTAVGSTHLEPAQEAVMQAFLGGYLEKQNSVAFESVRDAVAKHFPNLAPDGKHLSKLLRRLSFNRDYGAPAKSGIVYKRSGGPA